MTKEEKREYDRRYYSQNRERLLTRTRMWKLANPEYVRGYRKRNRVALCEYIKQWRKRNPTYQKEYLSAHPESKELHRKYCFVYSRKHYKMYPQKYRNGYLKRKYGITLSEFERLSAEQNGRCAICENESRLVMDHCHKTGILRSLLCSKCNTAIGLFNDDANACRKAYEYLLRHAGRASV